MPGGDQGPGQGRRNKKVNTDTEETSREGVAVQAEPPPLLASIREAINDSMAKSMSDLENRLFQQFKNFQDAFSEDIKKELGEVRGELRGMVEDNARNAEATSQRLAEAEERIDEVETLGADVKEYLLALKESHLELQSKVTELEGFSRRNNIRIYGLKEGAEGTSMLNFIENLLKTELAADTGLTELGIERAHRALGPRPAESAPPRSTVIKFLKYSTKEKILRAAWKKTIAVDGRKVFFDHDYATAVMKKRREYQHIKKVLKEKGIRFHTPMTRMRVFLDSGTVTYEDAHQAAEDLRAKGFPIPAMPQRRETSEQHLTFSWERATRKRGGANDSDYRLRVRDRLSEFRHKSAETTAEDTTRSPV